MTQNPDIHCLGLADKAVLVVGASSGIGEATARLFATLGSRVCLVARRSERLKSIAASIRADGGQCETITLDVTNESAAEISFDRTKEFFGVVDILVMSAGTGLLMPATKTDSDSVRNLLELNAVAVFRFCRAAGSKLSRGGSIVLMSSPAGIGGAPGLSAYALSKGGLCPLARSLAGEFAGRLIRVNVVVPGYVRTEMTEKLYNKLSGEQLENAVTKRHPLGPGTPDDVARAVVFLSSGAARWITGATLAVDGGYSAGYSS